MRDTYKGDGGDEVCLRGAGGVSDIVGGAYDAHSTVFASAPPH